MISNTIIISPHNRSHCRAYH